MIRGIRGATTVESNSNQDILDATQELLRIMIDKNGIIEDDVASVLFSATPELDDTFPAKAARIMGWTRTALMGFQEADVKHGLPMCVRVLIHWNTDKSIDEIQHVFLRDAVSLRPDLKPSSSSPKHSGDSSPQYFGGTEGGGDAGGA